MTHAPSKLLTVLLLGWLIAGCNSQARSGLPVVAVTLGGERFELEVSATDASRQKGLMERDTLAAHGGMIFIFADEAPRAFWMYHTRFPLDIVFLDAGTKIVSVHTMQPYVKTTTPSEGPAKFAIEIRAGEASRLGLKSGDVIGLPQNLPSPTE